jgi:hypothetical protein
MNGALAFWGVFGGGIQAEEDGGVVGVVEFFDVDALAAG